MLRTSKHRTWVPANSRRDYAEVTKFVVDLCLLHVWGRICIQVLLQVYIMVSEGTMVTILINFVILSVRTFVIGCLSIYNGYRDLGDSIHLFALILESSSLYYL